LENIVRDLLSKAKVEIKTPADEFYIPLASDFEREEPEFLWGNWIRLGQLNLLEARQGAGKTTFLMALAKQNELGVFPWQERKFDPGFTLYIGDEDSGGEILATYEDMGGDGSRLGILKPWLLDEEGLRKFEAYLDRKPETRLVIFDPFMATWPTGVSENDNVFLRQSLAAVRRIAIRRKIAIVLVRHFTKSIKGKHFSEYGGGGAQWQAGVRTQSVVLPHPGRNHRFVGVFPARGSLRAKRGEPFGYEIPPNGEFAWIAPADLPVHEFAEYYQLDVDRSDGSVPKGPTQSDLLEQFLRKALEGGPRYEDELKVEAAKVGLKPDGKPWRNARERVVGNSWSLEGFGKEKRVLWRTSGQTNSAPHWAGLEDEEFDPFAE
jgi:hypothetical protein